jgi:hypothetical protein
MKSTPTKSVTQERTAPGTVCKSKHVYETIHFLEQPIYRSVTSSAKRIFHFNAESTEHQLEVYVLNGNSERVCFDIASVYASVAINICALEMHYKAMQEHAFWIKGNASGRGISL